MLELLAAVVAWHVIDVLRSQLSRLFWERRGRKLRQQLRDLPPVVLPDPPAMDAEIQELLKRSLRQQLGDDEGWRAS